MTITANDRVAERSASKVEDELDPNHHDAFDDETYDERPLADQLSDIVDDAKLLFETEVSYFRARIGANFRSVKTIIALFGIGIAFGTAGLVALVLGLLLTLSPIIGPGMATAVVALGFCLLGGALIFWSVRKARRLPLGESK